MFKRIKLNKIIQREKNRNRAALNCLKELGFSLPDIRSGLIKMNNIKILTLAQNHGVKTTTLYNTVKGLRPNPEAQQISANALDLDVNELYPDSEHRTSRNQ